MELFVPTSIDFWAHLVSLPVTPLVWFMGSTLNHSPQKTVDSVHGMTSSNNTLGSSHNTASWAKRALRNRKRVFSCATGWCLGSEVKSVRIRCRQLCFMRGNEVFANHVVGKSLRMLNKWFYGAGRTSEKNKLYEQEMPNHKCPSFMSLCFVFCNCDF